MGIIAEPDGHQVLVAKYNFCTHCVTSVTVH